MNVQQLRNGLLGLAAVSLAGAGALQATGSATAIVVFLASVLAFSAAMIAADARRGALTTAIVCLGANAYLLRQKVDASTGSSICNVNEVLNCDVVNASAASELFGVPVTLFGVAFYAGLALAALLPERSTPKFHQVNGLFALLSLAFSAYLAFEAMQLSAVCVMCLTIYIGNALLLWSAFRGLEGGGLFDQLPSAANSNTFLAVSTVFVLALVVVVPQVDTGSSASEITRNVPSSSGTAGAPGPGPASSSDLTRLYNSPRGPVTLGGAEPTHGNTSAPYTILEFADYGCPHCAHAAKDLKQLVAQFPEVQVKFRVFPLTNSCNPALQQDPWPERCRAALAAECAKSQGRFWDLNALLFANQGRFDDADLAYMAKQVGLDMPAWQECMSSPSAEKAVLADAAAGARSGIMGTPTMYMKGTHGDVWIEVRDASAAAKLIEAHLTGASLPPPKPAL